MDKEALQKQLESMEEASEKWRAERRRLNSEIDKLETALADSKTLPKKRDSAADKGADPAALSNIQEAAEEKIRKASADWEAERAKFNSKINRLEGALAEAIARASNPLRVTQSVKEQFELELTRVAKEKTDLEQAFLRGKTEWEQEKLKLTGEMVKLRRAAQIMGRPVPRENTPEVNPKVLDLEHQLKESLAKWNGERESLVAQIHKLEESSRSWDAERRRLNDHAAQLQEAFVKAEAKIQSLEVAARKPNPGKVQIEDLTRENDGLQRELEAAREAWEAERGSFSTQIGQVQSELRQAAKVSEEARRNLQELQQAKQEERGRLESQIARLEEQLKVVSDSRGQVSDEALDRLREKYEQQLQTAAKEQVKVADELRKLRASAETESGQLKDKDEALQRQLRASQQTWDEERRRFEAEKAQLQEQLKRVADKGGQVSNEVVDQLRQQYEVRLQEAIREKSQLASELQSASASLEAERSRLKSAQKEGTGPRTAVIDDEVARVEEQINEIVSIIEDPASELSTVIRKNVEKAELDAYLRGILFTLGKK